MTDLSTLVEVLALKALTRAGWVRHGVPAPESVAAHSWGVAWLVLLFLPDELDRELALTYAVLHDLAEVRVGDLTPHDGVNPAEKAAREALAMAGLSQRLPRGEALQATWRDYEAQVDPESRFVRQLDRLDMAIQALAYAWQGAPGMSEFVRSARKVIEEPRLVEVLEAVEDALEVDRPPP